MDRKRFDCSYLFIVFIALLCGYVHMHVVYLCFCMYLYPLEGKSSFVQINQLINLSGQTAMYCRATDPKCSPFDINSLIKVMLIHGIKIRRSTAKIATV